MWSGSQRLPESGASADGWGQMSVCSVSPGLNPPAFAEYRSAGAALRLSPRGDQHTGICDAPGSPGGVTLSPGASHFAPGWLTGTGSGYSVAVTEDRCDLHPANPRAAEAGTPAVPGSGDATR
ncbi:hypothetical protein KRM28CT15_17260 [Krasilnikovia sp. M28-CT-15]